MDLPKEIKLPIVWVGAEDLPVLSANQFLLQRDQDGQTGYLWAGVMTPPPVLGSPEEQSEQLSHLSYVAVKPVARLAVSQKRLMELRELLDRWLDEWLGGEEQGEQTDA